MYIQASKSTVADNDAENIDIDAAMGDDHGSDDEESNLQVKEIADAVTNEMDDDEAVQDAPCKSP
jgi:hypothetical protein